MVHAEKEGEMIRLTQLQKVGCLYRRMKAAVDEYKGRNGNYPKFPILVFLMENAANDAPFMFSWADYREAKIKTMQYCIDEMKEMRLHL